VFVKDFAPASGLDTNLRSRKACGPGYHFGNQSGAKHKRKCGFPVAVAFTTFYPS